MTRPLPPWLAKIFASMEGAGKLSIEQRARLEASMHAWGSEGAVRRTFNTWEEAVNYRRAQLQKEEAIAEQVVSGPTRSYGPPPRSLPPVQFPDVNEALNRRYSTANITARIVGEGPDGPEYDLDDFNPLSRRYRIASRRHRSVAGREGATEETIRRAYERRVIEAEGLRREFAPLPTDIKLGYGGTPTGRTVDDALSFLYRHYRKRSFDSRYLGGLADKHIEDLNREINQTTDQDLLSGLYKRRSQWIKHKLDYQSNVYRSRDEISDLQSLMRGIAGTGRTYEGFGDHVGRVVPEGVIDTAAGQIKRLRDFTFRRNKFYELMEKGIVHDYMGTPSGSPGVPFLTKNALQRGEEYEVTRLIAPGELHYPGMENITEWENLPAHLKEIIPYPGPMGRHGRKTMGRTFDIPRSQQPEVVLRPRSMASESMMHTIRYRMGEGLSISQMQGEINQISAVPFKALEQNTYTILRRSENLFGSKSLQDSAQARSLAAIEQINQRISQTLRYKIQQAPGFATPISNEGLLREMRRYYSHDLDSDELLGHLISGALYGDNVTRAVSSRMHWGRPLKYVLDPENQMTEVRGRLLNVLNLTDRDFMGRRGPLSFEQQRRIIQERAKSLAEEWGLPTDTASWNRAINTQRSKMFREGMKTRDLDVPMTSLLEGGGAEPFFGSRVPEGLSYEDVPQLDEDNLVHRFFSPAGVQEYESAKRVEQKAWRRYREAQGTENESMFLRSARMRQSEVKTLESRAAYKARFRPLGESISEFDTLAERMAKTPSVAKIYNQARYIAHVAGLDPETASQFQSFVTKELSDQFLGSDTPFFGMRGTLFDRLETLQAHGELTGAPNIAMAIPGGPSIPARIRRIQTLERDVSGAGLPRRIGVHFELGGSSTERRDAIMALLRSRAPDASEIELETRALELLSAGWTPYQEFEYRSLAHSFARDVQNPADMSFRQLLDRAKSLGIRGVDAPAVTRSQRKKAARNITARALDKHTKGELSTAEYEAEIQRAAAVLKGDESQIIRLGLKELERAPSDIAHEQVLEKVTEQEAKKLRAAGFGEAAKRMEEEGTFAPYDIGELTEAIGQFVPVAPSQLSEEISPLQYLTVGQINDDLSRAAELPANTVHMYQHLMNMTEARPNELLTLTVQPGVLNQSIVPTLLGEETQGLNPEMVNLYQGVLQDLNEELLKHDTSLEELQQVSGAFRGLEIAGNRETISRIFGRLAEDQAEGIAYKNVRAPLALGTQIAMPGQSRGGDKLGKLFAQLVDMRKAMGEEEPLPARAAVFPRMQSTYDELLGQVAQGLASHKERVLSDELIESIPGRQVTISRNLRDIKAKAPVKVSPLFTPPKVAGEEAAEVAGQAAGEAAAQTAKAAERVGQTTFRDVWDAIAHSPNGALKAVGIGALIVGGLGAARLVRENRRNREVNEDTVAGPANMPGGNPYQGVNPYTYPLPPASPFAPSQSGVTYIVNARGVSNPQQTIQGMSAITGSNPSGLVYYAPNRPYASYQDDPDIQQILR